MLKVSGMMAVFIGHVDTARDYIVRFTVTHTQSRLH
jgi:hypothetical protein